MEREKDLKDRLKIIRSVSNLKDHDVLNSLQNINLALELLKLKGFQKEELDEIKEASLKIENIIKLTRWTSVLSNVVLKENLKADINSCFKKAISYFPNIKKEIISNCQTISVKIPSPLLIHFFYELIDNSLKHGGEKFSQIKVSCEQKENKIYIEYEDNGMGIPTKKRNRIFLEDMVKNHALYIMKGTLNTLEGDMEEKGEEKQGVKFIISVPIS